MQIGFLGLGNMGTAMALRLISAGHELRVWDRTEARADPLIHEGAILAGTPAEAELGADAVITMLWDDAAYEQVLFGSNGLVDALSLGGLHISCSTISVALSERLTEVYSKRAIDFVEAPVFGGVSEAERGELWVVAAGRETAVNRARPILEALSRGMTVVGAEPRQAHAVKLGGSFLAAAMIQSLGEAFVFAARQGVAMETFFEAVNDGLFRSPFYAACAHAMLHPPQQITSTLEVVAKDLRLLREAAASHPVRMSVADQLAETFAEARRSGPAGQDLIAGLFGVIQRRAGNSG
jgi:3-hydroxyisobutyrate dehydrogenase-like beta-hydroxyacid dehydrogenase